MEEEDHVESQEAEMVQALGRSFTYQTLRVGGPLPLLDGACLLAYLRTRTSNLPSTLPRMWRCSTWLTRSTRCT